MEVLKFGWKYWKKHLAGIIATTVMSLTALAADLMLPMITAMFINYVIQDNPVQQDNIFLFMLDGRFGAVHTMELFWNLAAVFAGLLLLKLILIYIKNVWNQKLGLEAGDGTSHGDVCQTAGAGF